MSTWDDNSPEAIAEAEGQEAADSLKELRAAANRSKANAAEAEAAKRELAFVKAGIDTETKQGQLLMKTYDGDMSPEAIKSYQREVFGIPGQEFVNDDIEPTEAEREMAQARQNLAASSNAAGALPDPDPYDIATKIARRAMEEGNEPAEDAIALGIHSLREAAAKGDTRVDARTRYPNMQSGSVLDV